MDYTNWISRGCLVGIFGLISFSAFAQSAPDGSVTYLGPYDDPVLAETACLNDFLRVSNGLASRGSSACNPSSTTNPCIYKVMPSLPGRSCDILYTSTLSGTQRYFYGCRVRANLVRVSDEDSIVSSSSFACNIDFTNPNSAPSPASYNTTSFHGYYSLTNDGPDCSNRPTFVSTTMRASTANGSGPACYQQCSYNVFLSYVGTYPSGHLEYEFVSNARSCSPSEQDPTTDPIDTTDPLDLSPDDGGVDADVPDPGPGKDSDGRGQSSGGGSCDSPPSCSGDSLQCNILYQTWATRCEAQRIADSTVGEPGEPGDAAGKVQALRDDLAGSLGSDGGVGNGAGLSDLGGLVSTKTFSVSDIDSSGWGFPRTCPLWRDVSFTVGASAITIPFSSMTLHCDIFEWTGYLIVAFASFWSVMLLIRSD